MASIAFTVTMTDGTTASVTAAVADVDVARLLAWAAATFPVQADADGNPVPQTAQSLVAQWISGAVAETMAKVHRHEQQAAADAAAAAVQPITVTIQAGG